MADGVGKIAVERELRVRDERIDGVMEALNGVAPTGDAREGALELRHVAHLDHEVEIAEVARPEPELAPRQAPSRDEPLAFEIPQIPRGLLGEMEVADTRLEVAPTVINVHALLPRTQFISACDGACASNSAI